MAKKKKRIRCKSKAKTTGKRCRKDVVPGYEVCNTHGGKTPRGWDSVHTKHGGYIDNPQERLFERYQNAINDPQIVDLKAEIALITTRIGEMISNLADAKRNGSIWNDVRDARDEIKRSMNSGDFKKMIAAYDYLDRVVIAGYEDQSIWDNLGRLVEQQRKLIESQHKLQTDADKLITIEDLTHSVMRLTAIIKKHVDDRKILSAINTDIREFMNAN